MQKSENKKLWNRSSKVLSVSPQGFGHIKLQATDTANPHTCGQADVLTLANGILSFGFLTIVIRKPSRQ